MSQPERQPSRRQLTHAEAEILPYLLAGLKEMTIAGMLRKSPKTINNQIRGIFVKHGVHSKPELIAMVRDEEAENKP